MSTVKLNWSVPAEEWKRFERYVEYKHGKTKGYIGREAELAMQEYAETDDWAGVEDLVDRLVQAAGRSVGGAKRKNNSLDVGADGESTRAYCRVSKDVKEEFTAHVKQTDKRLGMAFAHACQLRREGGRPDRVEDKLERVVDDAEAMLKVENENADAGESMGKKERQTVQVCRDVQQKLEEDGSEDSDTIPLKYVEGSIVDLLCDESTDPSNHYLPVYTEEVKERMGYVTKPGAPGLLIKEELVDPTPAYEQKEYGDLSRDERVEAVRVHVGRQARENGGLRQKSVERIREDLFENTPTKNTVKNYVEMAAKAGGFSLQQKHGKKRLKCKLSEVPDGELREYIETGDAMAIDDEQQTITTADSADADELWQAQQEATVRTDGGNLDK